MVQSQISIQVTKLGILRRAKLKLSSASRWKYNSLDFCHKSRIKEYANNNKNVNKRIRCKIIGAKWKMNSKSE